MGKRTKKISVNITEEQYQIIDWLARQTRRSVSEIAALILVDNSQQLFNEMQPKGEWFIPQFIPTQKPIDIDTYKGQKQEDNK